LVVSRTTAVTLCPRVTNSLKIRDPIIPDAPNKTTFIFFSPPTTDANPPAQVSLKFRHAESFFRSDVS
jgi:hypothetical protein